MELLRQRFSGLSGQLAQYSAIVVATLLAMEVLLGYFALQLMQDRAQAQLLRPLAAEISDIVRSGISRDLNFSDMQDELYHRFYLPYEVRIARFGIDGVFVEDVLATGGAASNLNSGHKRFAAETKAQIEDFLQSPNTILFPHYVRSLDNPEKKLPFAAEPLSVEGKNLGYVVVTPGAGTSRLLGSVAMDTTGVVLLIGGFGFSATGALWIGWLFSLKTRKRFSQLATGVKQVAEGKLIQPIPDLGAGDEISQIAAEISMLSAALIQKKQENNLILSSVTHDLNSPIASIAAYADELISNKETLDSSAVSKAAEVIFRNSNKCSEMLKELLELSRLDPPEEQNNVSVLDLAKVIEELIDTLSYRATKSGVTLTCELDHGRVLVSADGAKIQRVLTNLTENAIRHTPEHGTVTVGVHVHQEVAEVFVQDTGEGIPADEITGLLQPFSQGGHRSTRSKGLAGLGLFICKEILSYHQSELRVESTLGVGTKFSFALPRAKSVGTQLVE